MRRSLRFLLMGFVVAALATTGAVSTLRAQTESQIIPFTAVLNGGQEVPPNDSKASGTAFMTLDERTSMLSFSITYSDDRLSSLEVASHFHAPAIPGANAPVAFGLVQIGSPKNGSVGPLTLSQKSDLKSGLFYINIHTTLFPGGELRGQVLPVGRDLTYTAPEPVAPPPPPAP
ncbi:MAG: CHRD domain-containing protein [Candidatus Riflebacteria bacterium]|nr:CHRD domain-containing protein [Candidatus Riflebacteria bacterium]